MTRWLTPDHPNYEDTMEYGEGGSVVPGSYGGGGKDEDESSYRPTNPFYDALLAEEIAKAQKGRGAHARAGQYGPSPKKKGGRGGGTLAPASGIATTVASQLGDPEVLRAMGLGANNWGQGATGAAESRDRLNRAFLGGTGYDGGFGFGTTRPARAESSRGFGFGTPGLRFTAKPKQKNEYERRAETGRDRTFERGQKAADLNLELEFEKKRRAEFIKQLKGMIGSAMAKTRLQSGDEQVVNFAGLPVKVPTRGFREESNFDQILSMLK